MCTIVIIHFLPMKMSDHSPHILPQKKNVKYYFHYHDDLSRVRRFDEKNSFYLRKQSFECGKMQAHFKKIKVFSLVKAALHMFYFIKVSISVRGSSQAVAR